MSQLTEATIRAAKPQPKPYKLKDDRGLYLLVNPNGTRLWRLRFTLNGSESMVSLGAYPDVPLKSARERREEHRQLIAQGVNPAARRRSDAIARADTFQAIAMEWLQTRERTLVASTYGKTKWLLEELLFPDLGTRPVTLIEPPELLKALRRTEARGRHELAHRAKQTAGRVFRFAIQTGRATRDPSADLREALSPIISTKRAAITEPKLIGELLRALDGYRGHVATEFALRLAPLVFVRPGELRHAHWDEFTLDGDSAEWRIPAQRMKMREAHIVPLATQAVALLRRLRDIGSVECCRLLGPSRLRLRNCFRRLASIGGILRNHVP